MVSNQLFDLIKALSPSEKGYIKKQSFVSSNQLPFYIKLLDAISKQKSYDEKALLKKFKTDLNPKNISKYKNDLFHLILKRLTQFHEEKTIELKIKNLLNQGIILHKKGLTDLAIPQYQKVLKLALEYEEHTVALEVYQKLFSIYYAGKMGTEFPYLKEFEILGETVAKEASMYVLQTEIAEILFGDHMTEEAKVQKVRTTLSAPELLNISEDDSFISRWGKMCVESHSYYLLKEFDKGEESNKNQLQFLHEHFKIADKDPMRLIKHMNNLINSKFNVSAYEEIPPLLIEFENAKVKNSLYNYIEPLRLSCLYLHTLNYYLQTGEFTVAQERFPDIETWFEENKEDVSDYFLMLFYDAAFIINFTSKNYKKALEYVNLLVNSKSSFRKELQFSVKFYYIILHFELGNNDLVTYMLNALYRNIHTHTPHLKQDSENSILLRKELENVFDRKGLKAAAESLYTKMSNRSADEVWNLMYLPFLLSWLQASFKEKDLAFYYGAYFKNIK